MENEQEIAGEIKLTAYSRGAGCGCKIAPNVLEQILQSTQEKKQDLNLLVGNGANDDAAVYDLGNGTALISTTDFFAPVVDDAFDFGRIAAANAISDVYAMGGKPIMAIAILGWPVETLPADLAQQVLEGARSICDKAGISLAGGHSIDAKEPFFGLSVNGLVETANLKKNNTAGEGDFLFMTKAIGTGILSTAQKRGKIIAGHEQGMISQMATLNSLGNELGKIKGVSAMTDITGFGLLGHLIEMAEGAELSAELYYDVLPVMEGVKGYLAERIIPDATYRNWNSYSKKVSFAKGVNVMEAFNLLPDPQTNGGLLVSVNPRAVDEVKTLFSANGLEAFQEPIGKLAAQGDKIISVKQNAG